MWAAARPRITAGSPLFIAKPLSIRGVINLAGTIDMTANIAHMEEKCRGAVVTHAGRHADCRSRTLRAGVGAHHAPAGGAPGLDLGRA